MKERSNTQINDINKRLETIIGILLNKSIQQNTLTDKIMYLSELGYDNQDIAKILGTTYNMVGKVKSKSKKVKKNE